MDNTRRPPPSNRSASGARGRHQVTIRPVIDLAEEMTTDAYTPTERMVEQVKLRFSECPFPGCHRPPDPGHKAKKRKKRMTTATGGTAASAEQHGSDLDHRLEWPEGQTTSSNLFPALPGPPPPQDVHGLDV